MPNTALNRYSTFGIGVVRNHALKWPSFSRKSHPSQRSKSLRVFRKRSKRCARTWAHRAPGSAWISSEFGKHDSLLILVFALAVGVAGLARLIALKEQYLAKPLVGVNLGRKRRSVRDLEGHKPLPFRFERRHVDDDSAARIGRLPHADRRSEEHTSELQSLRHLV